MAKIDTSTIQGYAEMSAEQKLAALEAFDVPDAPDMSKWVSKADYDRLKIASDNNASEAADYKKKYNSKLTEAEQAEEAAREKDTRLAEYERKDKIATAKDEYIADGWDVALAKETAEAFVDGKMDVVRANMKKHIENVQAAEKDKAMKKTPAPPAGGNPNSGAINYDEAIAKAAAAGDFAEAARLSRERSEQKK